MIALFVVMAAVSAFLFMSWYEQEVTDRWGQAAANSCATLFEIVSMDNEDALSYPKGEYERWRDTLKSLCEKSSMEYMYAYRYDRDESTLTYIMCVAADDAIDERMARERGLGTVVKVDLSDQELALLAGTEAGAATIIDNQYGSMLAWFCKVDGWDNVVAGAEYSIHTQRLRVLHGTVIIAVFIIVVFLILLALQLRMLDTDVFSPIKVIANRMKEFGSNRLIASESLDIDSENELGEIARAYEEMARNINAYVNDIEHMTAERLQINVELDVARRIQLGMVPEHTILDGDGFAVYAASQPAREVGGDFYDCFVLDDGSVAAVIGDVSGKGVAAALFMAMSRAIIHDALMLGAGPAEALNLANARLCASNPEGMFVTAFVFVLNPKTGETRLANAGHGSPLVIGRDVRVFDMDPGILLGLFDDANLDEVAFELQQGESLLVVTDGVTEATNKDRCFLGPDGLTHALSDRAPFNTAEAIVDAVINHVMAFACGQEQFDDITVLTLRRNPKQHDTLALSYEEALQQADVLPVTMQSFAKVRDEILAKAPNRALGMQACLACEEAFVNIVSYSGAQTIWTSITERDGCLHITLADDGTAFNPLTYSSCAKPFEELDEGGMGINIIKETAQELAYHRTDGRNVLELLF